MTFRRVKLIEDSNLYLDEKVELLLIYANQKPATTIDIDDLDEYNEFSENYTTRDFEPILKLLDKTNLFHILGPKEWTIEGYTLSDGSYYELPTSFKTLYISKDPKKAKRLFQASKITDEKEMGRMYGFPETAIEAYKGERRPFIRENKYEHPICFFKNFIFSQIFFKEELESTSQRWHDTVKKLSPKLYQNITKFCEEVKVISYGTKWRDESGLY